MGGGECGNVFDGEGKVGLLDLGCEEVAEEEGNISLMDRLIKCFVEAVVSNVLPFFSRCGPADTVL